MNESHKPELVAIDACTGSSERGPARIDIEPKVPFKSAIYSAGHAALPFLLFRTQMVEKSR